MEKSNSVYMGVIIILASILFFLAGIVVGLKFEKQNLHFKDSEQIMLKIPKNRSELERQYLLNRAQHQILEQMLKWDMYKEEKK